MSTPPGLEREDEPTLDPSHEDVGKDKNIVRNGMLVIFGQEVDLNPKADEAHEQDEPVD